MASPSVGNGGAADRYRHQAVMYGEEGFLVIGGGWPYPDEGSLLDEVFEFNYTQRRWTAHQCRANSHDGER